MPKYTAELKHFRKKWGFGVEATLRLKRIVRTLTRRHRHLITSYRPGDGTIDIEPPYDHPERHGFEVPWILCLYDHKAVFLFRATRYEEKLKVSMDVFDQDPASFLSQVIKENQQLMGPHAKRRKETFPTSLNTMFV